MVQKFIVLGLVVFFPKAIGQWFVTVVLAFLAAYFTVLDAHWFAPFGPFAMWFVADYILIQMFFGLLNRRKTCVPQS